MHLYKKIFSHGYVILLFIGMFIAIQLTGCSTDEEPISKTTKTKETAAAEPLESTNLATPINDAGSSDSNQLDGNSTTIDEPKSVDKQAAELQQATASRQDLSQDNSAALQTTVDLTAAKAPQNRDNLRPELTVNGEIGQLVWESVNQDENLMDAAYNSITVDIAGPDGQVSKQKFGYGETPMLVTNLIDGVYVWQSTIQPEIDPAVYAALMAIRQTGNAEAMQKKIMEYRKQGLYPSVQELNSNTQSGTFRVQGGQLVTTDVTE